jgi:predicted O-linked N-acetylglucosamine transferase (SPINDLY family)
LDEAAASYRKALAFTPDFAMAYSNLGVVLKDQGQLDEAIASFHRALAIKPDDPKAHNNLGNALMDQRRYNEAVASYRQALVFKPDDANTLNNLGNGLQEQGRLDEAVNCYGKALSCKADFAEAHNNLGLTLRSQGKLDDAITSYRKAISIKPDYANARSNLLFLHAYQFLIDPSAYLALARSWEQACVPAPVRHAARTRTLPRAPLNGRRINVGYVSGDFRDHAVSYFIEQLFTHHDRARIKLFAYSTFGQCDEVTARLESLADQWVPVVGLSDNAMRERIVADNIDVLVDLSGHTAHNRLGVFARRAAPVQAYYLGYFASTGLTEMDYWIGDEVLTPAETDSHFSEQVWRLPRTCVTYNGKIEAPLPAWSPAADHTVWLGSFNQLNKLTPATLALWAKVLQALPEGRLLLKTKQLADAGNRQRILDALSAHGIASHRVELQDGSTTPAWAVHMAYYDRLDIALDPVGAMGGVTTTCDALWMTVPVVTLIGDRVASRMTASLLNAIGHPEWVAQSEAEYIDKVIALARNVELRRNLRTTQRSEMARSPLCDGHDLAFNLENAYFEMFERWLAPHASDV